MKDATATEPRSGDESVLPFDLAQVFRALVANKWLILGFTLAATLVVAFWTIKQPKVYEATVSVEYDPNPPRPMGGQVEEVAAEVSTFWATKEFYETQNRIITSRTVGERVVRKLGLHTNAGFMHIPADEREAWSGTSIETAAQVLAERITINQPPDSRIVTILVRDWSAERAALIANTIAETYIEKTLEDRLGTTVSALEWLSTQLDDLRDELQRSELALHQFKQDHNILSVSLQDRQNMIAGTIEQLNQALTQATTRRIELASRLQALREANADDPTTVHATLIDQDVRIQALRTRLAEKSSEREALAVRYGPNHPMITAIDAEITAIREDMRDAVDGLVDSVAGDLSEVRSSENGLRAALEEANQAGLALNLREIEYDRLNRERENHANLYKVILERTAETNLTKLARVAQARVLDRALEPTEPVAPKMIVNLAVGAVAGLFLGLLGAVIRMRMDRTIRDAEDAEALGLTVLGVIPKIDDRKGSARVIRYGRKARARAPAEASPDKDLIVHTEPRSAVAESARSIRTNVMFMSPGQSLKSLVVTSPRPREGKTTVAVSLAITMAQSGRRVLLADTDLRRPRLHRVFGCSSSVGTTTILIGDARLDSAVQQTVVPGLFVLPCGPIPPNPSELLHTNAFAALVEEARRKFDFVIFDSPPLGAVTDAAIMGPQLDGVLVVLRAGSTTRDALSNTLRQLRDVSSKVVGGVLNDLDLSQRPYRAGGYYYYHSEEYGPVGDDDQNRPSASAAE